jgi:hypothetical protein
LQAYYMYFQKKKICAKRTNQQYIINFDWDGWLYTYIFIHKMLITLLGLEYQKF